MIHATVSVAVTVIVLGCFAPARAALFSIDGLGDRLMLDSLNDLIPTPGPEFQALVPGGGVIADPDSSGLFSSGGAQLSTTAANVAISFDYIGSFAEATNVFNAGSATFQNSGIGETGGGDSSPQPPIQVVQAVAGPVDFGFSTSLDGGSFVDNVSGSNPVGVGLVSYLMSFLESDGAEGDWKLTTDPTNIVLILFDDAGKGPDANDFDDLGVIAIATPLPASLPLFAAALGGLVVMVWRRNARVSSAPRSDQS